MIDLEARAEALAAVLLPYARSDAPGVVAALRCADGQVWRGAAGMASRQSGAALTPGTRMRIGSITKMFTAATVIALAEEGRFGLDASPRTLLPGLPPLYDQVTLRHMLSHTSGLWCNLTAHVVANGPSLHPLSPDQAAADAVRQTRLGFAPGERLNYSNAAYLVLGRVVEAVEGRPLEAVFRQRFFEPLGMHDTALVRSDLMLEPGLADLHVALPGGTWMRGIFPLPLGGEGGLISTADDLLGWLAALGRTQSVNPAIWASMTAPVLLGDGRVSNVSMGVMHTRWRGADLIYHDGGVIGAAARAMTVPELGLDLVILINRNDLPLDKIGRALLEAACGDERPEEAPWPASRVGDYHAPGSGRMFRLFDLDGVPMLDIAGAHSRLRDVPGGLAGDSVETATLTIVPSDASEAPASITVQDGGAALVCGRLPPLTARQTPPLGRYTCADLAAEADIVSGDESPMLLLRGAHGTHTHALRPLGADLWRARSLMGVPFEPLIEVVRSAGRIEALLLSTQRLQQLRFTPRTSIPNETGPPP